MNIPLPPTLIRLLDWGSPQLLYGLIALLVLPLLWLLIRHKELYFLAKLGPGGINLVQYIYCRRRARIRTALICLGVAGLIIGLAKPRDGYESIAGPTTTKSLLVAVDVSASMNATDIKPSRLQRAVREIIDLTGLWAGHELGLIIFAGQAYMHLPLTQDLTMVRLFANSLAVDMISAQGTDLGAAIALATDNLHAASTGNRRASHDLLIITDGEDHPNQVLTIAAEAQTHGIRIFTMGLGSPEGAPIRLADGSFKRQPGGELVISKLDEHTLIQLANITGGHYVRSEAGQQDLLTLYEQGLKDAAEREGESADLRLWHELYQWPSLLALLAFILAFLITPYQGLRALIMLPGGALILASLLPYPPGFASAATARELFDQAKTVLTEPQPPAEALQAASAALLELTRRAQASQDRHLLHAAQYNLFHLYLKQGKLEQAYQAIVAAYTADDTHAATLDNLKWLKELLEAAKHANNQTQPQQQPADPNQEQGQQKQEEQKNNPSPGATAASPNPPTAPAATQQDQAADAGQAKETAAMDSGASTGQPPATTEPNHGASDAAAGTSQQPRDESAASQQTSSAPAEEPAGAETKEDKLINAAEAGQAGDDADSATTAAKTGSGAAESSADQPTAMAPDQAENLFRSLEENLEIFGRKHHDSGKSQRNATKDW